MADDSYNDDDEKYKDMVLDKQPSEISVVDEEKSWAELQSRLYSAEAEKIADNKWMQLRCKTSTLTYSVAWVNCLYIIVAVVCIPIGVVTYFLSQSVVMQEFPAYDSLDDCALSTFDGSGQWGRECTQDYTIDYDFEPPIYFHYKLTHFFQNHRSYVKSRSEVQLHNEDVLDVRDCDPDQVRYSLQGLPAQRGYKMLPCGLIANSFFNDKFKATLIPADGSAAIPFCDTPQCDQDERQPGVQWSEASWQASPNWDKSDIAWETDVKGKFRHTEQVEGVTTNVNELQRWQNVTLPSTDDQDFIVWMRTATVPTFSRLHRVIREQPLRKGDTLRVTIRNYFHTATFNGQKSLLITTNSELGGRNDVLGIIYMVIGSLALLTACLFRLFITPEKTSLG